MAKQKQVDCPPGTPAWLASYGDMITLVLCFFILMYANAVVNVGKLAEVSASFRGETVSYVDFTGNRGITDMLGNGIIDFPLPTEASQVVQERTDNYDTILERYREELTEMFSSPWETYEVHDADSKPEMGLYSLSVLEDFTVKIELGSDLLFGSGSDSLRSGLDIIRDVSVIIARAYRPGDRIIVEGHTDTVPVSGGSSFRDNWDLSSARARTVIRAIMAETGLPGEAFTASGESEFKPIASNDTAEGRALNRRVVLYVEAASVDDLDRFRSDSLENQPAPDTEEEVESETESEAESEAESINQNP